MKNYYFLNDGDVISDTLIEYFIEADYIIKRTRGIEVEKIVNMVGIIIHPDLDIYIFPKNFSKPNQEHTKLLLNTILKYFNKNSNLNLFKNDDFHTNFPLNSFYEIYEYYMNHGLYLVEETKCEIGKRGKISWKRSLKSENMIFTKKGVVLNNFVIQGKISNLSLITNAMITAINYTVRTFRSFLHLHPIMDNKIEEFFVTNPNILIEKLYSMKSSLYKDIHLRLVDSLISFYSKIDGGGTIQFKHYNFDVIWEDMVEHYLCNYLIKDESGIIKFSDEPSNYIGFKRHKVVKINDSKEFQTVVLDHFYEDEKYVYLFDSKYYKEITGMNYKQISYGFSLLNENNDPSLNEKIKINALFLPGNEGIKQHFKLNPQNGGTISFSNVIYEYYLDVQMLMELYLKKR